MVPQCHCFVILCCCVLETQFLSLNNNSVSLYLVLPSLHLFAFFQTSMQSVMQSEDVVGSPLAVAEGPPLPVAEGSPVTVAEGKFPVSESGRCSHNSFWTRLRGKRGHSYFYCTYCGVFCSLACTSQAPVHVYLHACAWPLRCMAKSVAQSKCRARLCFRTPHAPSPCTNRGKTKRNCKSAEHHCSPWDQVLSQVTHCYMTHGLQICLV